MSAADEAIAQGTIEGVVNESGFLGRTNVFDDRGILPPGSYQFFTHATLGEGIPNISGSASFDIHFSLGSAATPEPASLALLATGVAAAGMTRRRNGQPKRR